jgi:predicted LPLAT superfamily acyltransferase
MTWRDRPEAGSPMALRLMEWLATTLGRRLVGYLLYPVILYFYLVRGYERRASRKFLERVYQRPATAFEVYSHLLAFGRVTVDRIFLMSGHTDQIPMRFFNSAPLAELVKQGRSGVFLAAHFGSFEAARLIAVEHPQVSMRIVVDSEVNPNFMARMASLDPDFSRSIIDPHGSAAELGIEIAAAMREKQWVGFLADRVFDTERTIEVQFLGATVRLPAGPFMVAAGLLRCFPCCMAMAMMSTAKC